MVLGIVTIAVGFFYLGYEFFALATGRKLITTFVREAFRAYPPMGFLVGLALGLLSGHFFWCWCATVTGG
jgi:hypothetical protein